MFFSRNITHANESSKRYVFYPTDLWDFAFAGSESSDSFDRPVANLCDRPIGTVRHSPTEPLFRRGWAQYFQSSSPTESDPWVTKARHWMAYVTGDMEGHWSVQDSFEFLPSPEGFLTLAWMEASNINQLPVLDTLGGLVGLIVPAHRAESAHCDLWGIWEHRQRGFRILAPTPFYDNTQRRIESLVETLEQTHLVDMPVLLSSDGSIDTFVQSHTSDFFGMVRNAELAHHSASA